MLLVGCSYTDFEDIPPSANEKWQTTTSLYHLDTTSMPITEDIVVEGTVITSDSASNFYKELIISDATLSGFASLRLPFGFYDSYSLYPVGSRVAVNLKGLVIGTNYGVLSAGYLAESSGEVASIPTPYLALSIINHQGTTSEPYALPTVIDSLTIDMAGRLVELNNCYFAEQFGTYSSSREIAQEGSESTAILYTSPWATFSSDGVTTGLFSVRAVVLNYNSTVELKVSSLSDICPL